jgi:hypothetical protein
MLHRDSTIQKCLTVRRFSVPCQPSGRSSHPVRTMCHTVRTPDRPSIIRPDDVSLCLDPPLCREGSIQLASVRTSLSTRSVSDFFPSSKKGKIDQPSGRCGIPSGHTSPEGKNRNSIITVRTSDSYGPDACSSKKEIADSTSTVRTTAYKGPDARIADMEIAC